MHYLMHAEYLQADCIALWDVLFNAQNICRPIALWDALFNAHRIFAGRLHYGMHYLMHVEYLQADCIMGCII